MNAGLLRGISRNLPAKRPGHPWMSLAVFFCAFATAGAAVELKTYWEFKEAEDFSRLTEYFTGQEPRGNRILLRSVPEQRAGLYFSVRLKGGIQALPEGSKAVVEAMHPESVDPRKHTFDLPAQGKNYKELMLGLTGENWPSAKDKPMAWRIQVLDAMGEVLGTSKSYLWR